VKKNQILAKTQRRKGYFLLCDLAPWRETKSNARKDEETQMIFLALRLGALA
jgi:hypothetical protein